MVGGLALAAALGSSGPRLLFIGPYLASCTLLSLAWLGHCRGAGACLGVQKNPSGQFIVVAILIVLGMRLLRPVSRTGLVAVLLVGLWATGSRGSVLGLVAGVATLWIASATIGRRWAAVGGGALAAGVIVLLLPSASAAQISSRLGSGDYSGGVRLEFLADAYRQARQHLLDGVGVGQYRPLDPRLSRIPDRDPHNIVLHAAAEGGLILVFALALLFGVVLYTLWKLRRTVAGRLALAVQISLLAHGLVDIYWVRATPTVGWYLTGAAILAVVAGGEPSGDDAPPTKRVPDVLRR